MHQPQLFKRRQHVGRHGDRDRCFRARLESCFHAVQRSCGREGILPRTRLVSPCGTAMLKLVSPEAIDLCLVGGDIVDVQAGATRRAAVGIHGDRIVAIGADAQIAPRARQVADVAGQTIVPGYIEPHGHVILANPVEFAGAVLRGGTTMAVTDTLPLMLLARPDRLAGLLEQLAGLPMKFRWLIRLHPQSFAETGERFSLPTVRSLWRLPSAAAVGEVTGWVDVLQGDADLTGKIRAARDEGKPVEGHAAGASFERLAALARAGFTSCHEAVTADDVRDRLRAGLVTMLRHSSIRPDLPDLLQAVTREEIASGRVMLTADGPTPAFIADRGYLDHLLEVAIAAGVQPIDALRMVTVNPARYYGIQDAGQIAVGYRADVNVIPDLSRMTPTVVIADGKIVAKNGALTAGLASPAWKETFEPAAMPRLPAGAFAARENAPGMRLVNDVITEPVPVSEIPPGALRVALLDRRGRWITRTRVIGLADRLGGLATTISSGFDIVVLGHNPADMAAALARIADMGGGLAVIEEGREVFSLPLELVAFSLWPWASVVQANRQFNRLMEERGYRFADPVFSLLFLTFDSLPWIRLTSRGVWDVRNRRVLSPSTPL